MIPDDDRVNRARQADTKCGLGLNLYDKPLPSAEEA